MYGRPSYVPTSYTSQMYGLRTCAAARASRMKRSVTVRDATRSCAKSLTATSLPMLT